MNGSPRAFTLAWLAAGFISQAAVAAEPVAGEELKAIWLPPHDIEVAFEGKPYRGQLRGEICRTPACRGVFRNVPKHQRRHVRHGETRLTSADGDTLRCVWVSHPPRVEGACDTPEGRRFELKVPFSCNQKLPCQP